MSFDDNKVLLSTKERKYISIFRGRKVLYCISVTYLWVKYLVIIDDNSILI